MFSFYPFTKLQQWIIFRPLSRISIEYQEHSLATEIMKSRANLIDKELSLVAQEQNQNMFPYHWVLTIDFFCYGFFLCLNLNIYNNINIRQR